MTKNYTYIKIGIVALFVAMMMFSITATANTTVSDPVTKVSVFDQTDHSVTLSFYLPENSGTNENGMIKSSITAQEVPTGQITYYYERYGMTFAKKNGLYHRIVYIGGLTNNTDYTFTVQNYNQDGTINQPSVPITTKTYR